MEYGSSPTSRRYGLKRLPSLLRSGGGSGRLVRQLDQILTNPTSTNWTLGEFSLVRRSYQKAELLFFGGDVMYKIVRSSPPYQQIVQQVEKSIHKGGMKPGAPHPPQQEPTQHFSVSRTALPE